MDIITPVLYMAYNTSIVRKKDTKQLIYVTMSYSKHDGRDRAPCLEFRTSHLQAADFRLILNTLLELSGPESHELSSAQAAALLGAPFQVKPPVSSPCLSASDPGSHTR